MDLLILEGLEITLDLAEIAVMKGVRVDNPRYIPPMPEKGIPEQNYPPFFSKTEIVLKSGEKMVLDVAYAQMVNVVKTWIANQPGPEPEPEGELLQESETVEPKKTIKKK